MDKKTVYIALISSTLGLGIGSQFPGAEARAAIAKAHKHVFQGVANTPLTTTIESGVAADAAGHANNQLGLTGDDALSHTAPAQCPIRRLNFECRVENGERVWQWEYATKNIEGTWSVGEPQ